MSDSIDDVINQIENKTEAYYAKMVIAVESLEGFDPKKHGIVGYMPVFETQADALHVANAMGVGIEAVDVIK